MTTALNVTGSLAVSGAASLGSLAVSGAASFNGASFSGAVSVPQAASPGSPATLGQADGRYGRLAESNTWSQAQTFSSTISVANATADGHALNRTTGDGRYAPLSHTHNYLTQSEGDGRYAPLSHTHTYLTQSAGDARYGRLAESNTWSQAQTFSSTISVGNATAGGHALNRTTGDGRYAALSHAHSYLTQDDGDARYGRITGSNTWTQINYFNQAIYLKSSLIDQSSNDLLYRALGNDHNFQNTSGVWATVNFGAYNQYSDIKNKSSLRNIPKDRALAQVRAFSPQDYFLNQDTSRRRAGLIAQDVQAIDPELVTEKDGSLLIDYTGVLVKLIAAVQEIDDRLTALEKGA